MGTLRCKVQITQNVGDLFCNLPKKKKNTHQVAGMCLDYQHVTRWPCRQVHQRMVAFVNEWELYGIKSKFSNFNL